VADRLIATKPTEHERAALLAQQRHGLGIASDLGWGSEHIQLLLEQIKARLPFSIPWFKAMALLRLQAVKRPELLQGRSFPAAFLAPGVQPLRSNSYAMHQGTEHRIGIEAAAVLAADRAVVPPQGLLHVVQQSLPQELMQRLWLHGHCPPSERVIGAGVHGAVAANQNLVSPR
jgi:hypothetical protein